MEIDIEKEIERIKTTIDFDDKRNMGKLSIEQKIVVNIDFREQRLFIADAPDWVRRMKNYTDEEVAEHIKEAKEELRKAKQQLYDYLVNGIIPSKENWILKF